MLFRSLDQGQIYGVLKALIAGDARAALSAVAHLAEHGPDWAGVLAEILNALHRIAIAQLMPDAIDNGQGDREQVLALAALLPPEDVQFYYQLGLIGRRDLPLAPDPRDGFEMVLLRMLAFRPASLPGTPPTTPLLQPEALAGATSSVSARLDAATVPSATVSAPVVTPDQQSQANLATAVPVAEPVVADRSAEPVQPHSVSAAESVRAPWEAPFAAVPVEAQVTEPQLPSLAATAEVALSESSAESAPVPAATLQANSATEQYIAALESEHVDDQPEPNYEQEYSQAFAAESDGEDEEAYLDNSGFQEYADLSSIRGADAAAELNNGSAADLQLNIPVATGLAAEWQALFAQLNLAGMTHSIAANTLLVEKNADTWLLHLDPNHSALFNKTQLQRINEAINKLLDAPIELQIEQHVLQQETPALALLRKQAKRQQEAEAAIYSDPIVLQLMDTFGAIISASSIEPIDSVM